MGQTSSKKYSKRRSLSTKPKMAEAPLAEIHFVDDSPMTTQSKRWMMSGGGDEEVVASEYSEEESVGENEENNIDIFYDAVEEEERFPLTMSKAHKFIDAEEFSKLVASNVEDAKSEWMNSYSEPPAGIFLVRAPGYLARQGKNMKDLKAPSMESPYEVIGVNMFHCDRRLKHVSDEVGEMRRFFQNHPADKDPHGLPMFLNINWVMSPLFGKECWVVNHVFRLKKNRLSDPAVESAFRRFKQGTDAQKNTQFKYIFRIVDAPGPLKSSISALGGERPVIIGKSLTTTYNEGDNYLEVNMDVSSSRIASAINGILLKNIQMAVCDCAWLLEGQREEELPERILAAIRWNWNRVEDVVVNLDTAGERL